MGARTTQAELRVVEQRAHISKMLDDLERRVQEDVDGVRSNVSERVSGISERASGVAQRVPGAEALTSQVAAHPLASVLGGFTTGMALGMASAPAGADEDGGPTPSSRAAEARPRRDGAAPSRLFDVFSSAAMGAVAGPLREEMQTLVRQAASGFLGNGPSREERTGAASTPPNAAVPAAEIAGSPAPTSRFGG